jgi:hypothetical protein
VDRAKLLPVCLLCSETPTMGIMGGVVLRGKFLCTSCEKHILSLEVNSSEYDVVVEKLKSLWDCR